MTSIRASDLRRSLRASVAASAAPYGYTLTIFSTGSVASYIIGTPHVFEVLLFVAGAVLAFLIVEIVAYGRLRARVEGRANREVDVWAHAHLLSSGLAILISWTSLQVLHSNVGWLIVGLLSTAVYLVVNAVQAMLAGHGP